MKIISTTEMNVNLVYWKYYKYSVNITSRIVGMIVNNRERNIIHNDNNP